MEGTGVDHSGSDGEPAGGHPLGGQTEKRETSICCIPKTRFGTTVWRRSPQLSCRRRARSGQRRSVTNHCSPLYKVGTRLDIGRPLLNVNNRRFNGGRCDG